MASDRRQFSRVAFHGDARLFLPDGAHAVDILDISLKGVLIRVRDAVPVHQGSQGALQLPLANGERIRMEVVVAHDMANYHGLQCRDIDLDSITHLRRLIELNLGDATLADRELALLVHD